MKNANNLNESEIISYFQEKMNSLVSSNDLVMEQEIRFGKYRSDYVIRTIDKLIIIEFKIGEENQIIPSSEIQQLLNFSEWIKTAQSIDNAELILISNLSLTYIQKEALEESNILYVSIKSLDDFIKSFAEIKGPNEKFIKSIKSYYPPEYLLLSDSPIDTKINDLFGFDPLASTIAKQVVEGPDNLTIGIMGDWGSGKTSLMHLIQEYLDTWSTSEKPLRTVWYNPWLFQNEPSPVVSLLRVLRQSSISNKWVSPAKFKTLDLFKAIASEAGKMVLNSGTTSTFSKLIVDNTVEIIEKGISNLDDYKSAEAVSIQLQKYFSEAVDEIVGKDGRLAIFIDDLDRCIPELVISVLEIPQLYLKSPKCILIFGLDPKIIEQAVDFKYNLKDNFRRGYLEKIIQLPINIPKPLKSTINQYINYLTNDRLSKYGELICNGFEDSPRQAKRLLNYYMFRLEAAKASNFRNIEPGLILKLTILQMSWQEFYEKARENMYILLEQNIHNIELFEENLAQNGLHNTQNIDKLWRILNSEPKFDSIETIERYLSITSII